tara:strand:+ start:1992 stop:3191 length:1200 start_codon:yes stop_codon:yes gene_type:complete
MFKTLDSHAVIALIFLPLALIVLVTLYLVNYQLGWFEVLLFLSGYYISNITVGIGLHRLWSHDTYKTNKYVELILAILAAGTLQGPALSWASNHFKHHSFTDTEKDPHTPLKYKNRIKGFFWSHMGWMLAGNGSYKSIDRVTMVKLGKNKILRWQLKHYWSLAIIMNSIVPAIIGYIFGGTMIAAYAGLIFIGLGRAVQQQITFFVNSLCHFVGKQTYIKGTSGDIWWLAVLLLGENWHNFHHAFPSDYRNGAKWYQTDVHKWIIYLMSKCGLAWDLKRTAKVRVDAKISQTTNQITSLHKEKLEAMRSQVEELVVLYQETKLELENSSLVMKSKLNKSFVKIQENLNSLRSQLNAHLRNFDSSSDKILKIISKKVKKADLSMQKIYKEIERLQTFASN